MDAIIESFPIAEITERFQALASLVPLHMIRSEQDYGQAVAVLNQLLDSGAADAGKPLADLVNTLGSLISDYEDKQLLPAEVSPALTLRFLMQQHDLSQSDLPEVGSQGVVSEILNGKRELNVRQIKVLSKRFHVPVTVFL